MRRFACVVAIVGMVACGDGSGEGENAESLEPVELTANLDFEAGVGDEGRPADWTGGGEGYELSVDEAEKHGGNASGRIRASVTAPSDGFGTLTKCTDAAPLTGSKITYAGFLKTQDVTGSGGLWFRVDGPQEGEQQNVLAFDNMSDRPIRGTTDWERHEIVLDVADEAVQVCFGFLLTGLGTVWGDDLSVSRSAG